MTKKKFTPRKSKVHYSGPLYGKEEIHAAMDTLRGRWLVSGRKVGEFEESLSKYLDAHEVVAVNSGSSANLLSIACLMSSNLSTPLKARDEVITSALTFPTTVSPIIQYDLTPVFVDVDDSLNMDLQKVAKAVTSRTRALMVLHFLGNPVDMSYVHEIAERHNLFVVEDACDGLGSTFEGKKIGTFGNFGTLSFYPAHHITTLGEGGAVICNTKEYAPIVRSLRDWGRACVCPICEVAVNPDYNCPIRHKTDIPELKGYDKRYLYVEIGYNLKMTEIQGAVGTIQLKKHNIFTLKRMGNVKFYHDFLSQFHELSMPTTIEGGEANWFAFPILVNHKAAFSRNDICAWLEKHNIETRPLFTGNITSHPAYKNISCRVHGKLTKTNWARDRGFFIGCYAGVSEGQREYVAEVFQDFLN